MMRDINRMMRDKMQGEEPDFDGFMQQFGLPFGPDPPGAPFGETSPAAFERRWMERPAILRSGR